MKEYKTILISKAAWTALKKLAAENRRSILSTVDLLVLKSDKPDESIAARY